MWWRGPDVRVDYNSCAPVLTRPAVRLVQLGPLFPGVVVVIPTGVKGGDVAKVSLSSGWWSTISSDRVVRRGNPLGAAERLMPEATSSVGRSWRTIGEPLDPEGRILVGRGTIEVDAAPELDLVARGIIVCLTPLVVGHEEAWLDPAAVQFGPRFRQGDGSVSERSSASSGCRPLGCPPTA
jgi:hypothetical protein